MTQYLPLMKTLPPLVWVVVWDVINDGIDELTLILITFRDTLFQLLQQ